MRVRELIDKLRVADPSSVVLFLENYADVSESDEIRYGLVPRTPWMRETGRCFGEAYDVRLPEREIEAEPGRTDVVQIREPVVILSNGLTNIRFNGGKYDLSP